MKNEFPLVSIVLPTLNNKLKPPKYIEAAFGSIINQTYKNIEVIVSDNCSYYDVYELLKLQLRNDLNEIFEKKSSTIPLAEHMNLCFSYSSGKYFFIISDDDIITDNFNFIGYAGSQDFLRSEAGLQLIHN